MQPLNLEFAERLAEDFFARHEDVAGVSREYGRDEIVAFLRDNIAAIQSEVEGMSAEQLAYRPLGTPEGADASGDEAHFNTAEIVTHMAAGTAFHWWNITRALHQERPPMPKAPEGKHVTGTNNNKSIMGGGGWDGLSGPELAAHLGKTAGGFLDYIEAQPEEAFSAGTSSFPPFHNMTPHDWLFLVAIHAAMHLNQIRNMKAQADYPGR